MKRPPIGGVAALGRLHRAYDSGAFDPAVWGIFEPCEDEAVDGRNAQRAAVPVGMANRPNRRKAVRQPLFVSRSRKILAVAPSANNGGLIALIVFEMAESPRLDDPERNAGSGIYLSITIRHGTSRELATTGTKSFVPAKVGCGAVL
jgi:hypothetical protein